jgi:hypothetical protein
VTSMCEHTWREFRLRSIQSCNRSSVDRSFHYSCCFVMLCETKIMCCIHDQDNHIWHYQPLKVPGDKPLGGVHPHTRIYTGSTYILRGRTAYVQTFKLPLFRQLVPRNPNLPFQGSFRTILSTQMRIQRLYSSVNQGHTA